MIRHFIFGSAAIAAMIGFAAVPAYADEGQEVATAAAHAGMAAASADIKMVHMHLHHVVNCLVGPSGTGFDKAAGNPCDGKGNGALMDNPGDKKAMLEDALTKANAGIAADDVDASKKLAADAQTALMK